VVFKSRTRLDTLKRRYGNSVHWESARGSQEQCVRYCSKEETRVAGTETFWWGDIRREYPQPKRPLHRYRMHDLYGWQKTMLEECKLLEPCDPTSRQVVYIWSRWGKVGKTRLALTLCDSESQNWLCVCGSVGNISYLVSKWVEENPSQELHGVIVDVPRCSVSKEDNHAWFSVAAVEALCNGLIVNTKYECKSVRFNRCVVCLRRPCGAKI